MNSCYTGQMNCSEAFESLYYYGITFLACWLCSTAGHPLFWSFLAMKVLPTWPICCRNHRFALWCLKKPVCELVCNRDYHASKSDAHVLNVILVIGFHHNTLLWWNSMASIINTERFIELFFCIQEDKIFPCVKFKPLYI